MIPVGPHLSVVKVSIWCCPLGQIVLVRWDSHIRLQGDNLQCQFALHLIEVRSGVHDRMPSQNQYRIRQFHSARFCPALRVFSSRIAACWCTLISVVQTRVDEAQASIFQNFLIWLLQDLISNFSSYVSMLIYRWNQNLWVHYCQIDLISNWSTLVTPKQRIVTKISDIKVKLKPLKKKTLT